jgi:hypothetical protein
MDIDLPWYYYTHHRERRPGLSGPDDGNSLLHAGEVVVRAHHQTTIYTAGAGIRLANVDLTVHTRRARIGQQ